MEQLKQLRRMNLHFALPLCNLLFLKFDEPNIEDHKHNARREGFYRKIINTDVPVGGLIAKENSCFLFRLDILKRSVLCFHGSSLFLIPLFWKSSDKLAIHTLYRFGHKTQLTETFTYNKRPSRR